MRKLINSAGFISGTAVFAIVVLVAVMAGTISIVRDMTLNYQDASIQLDQRNDVGKAFYSIGELMGDPDQDGIYEITHKGAAINGDDIFPLNDTTRFMSHIPKLGADYFKDRQGRPVTFCSYDYGQTSAPHTSDIDALRLGGLYKMVQGQANAATPVTYNQVKDYPLVFAITAAEGDFEIDCQSLYNAYENAGFDESAFQSGLRAEGIRDVIRPVSYAEAINEFNPAQRLLLSLDASCALPNVVIRWNVDGQPECVEETDPNLMQLAKENLPTCGADEVLTVKPTDESQAVDYDGLPDYNFICQAIETFNFEFESIGQDNFSLLPHSNDPNIVRVGPELDGALPIYTYTKVAELTSLPERAKFAFLSIRVTQFGVARRGLTLELIVEDDYGTQTKTLFSEEESYDSVDTYHEEFSISKTIPVGGSVSKMWLRASFIAGEIPEDVAIPDELQSQLNVVVDYLI